MTTGRCILNTRAQHQAVGLTKQLEAEQISVIELPLLAIEPVVFSPEKISDFDIIIFSSANAVQHFFSQTNLPLDRKTVIAVGSATQRVLFEKGISNVLCPDHFDSEGVLAMPVLQKIENKVVMLVCGENPKPLLQDTLRFRGAQIMVQFCYRRVPIPYDLSAIFHTLSFVTDIICTSQENLTRLLALFSLPRHRAWLLNKTLIVISDAMKEKARDAGFLYIVQAENATDEAILKKVRENMSADVTPKKVSAASLSAIIIAIAALLVTFQNIYLHLRDEVMMRNKIVTIQKTVSRLENNPTLQSERMLSNVRYLIQLANVHLLVDHDVGSALSLLQMAQAELIRQNEAGFSELSQALTSDITALQNVSSLDFNQTFLSLSQVIQSIQQLSPIPTSPTISIEKTAQAMKTAGEQALPWRDRIFASLKQLKSLFVIRHLDQPNIPIVTPEVETLIKQNMMMQLNMAQWALLHRNQKIYDQALQNVTLWMNRYFALTEEKNSILTQLSSLQSVQIQPALPSLSKTLTVLDNINPAVVEPTVPVATTPTPAVSAVSGTSPAPVTSAAPTTSVKPVVPVAPSTLPSKPISKPAASVET